MTTNLYSRCLLWLLALVVAQAGQVIGQTGEATPLTEQGKALEAEYIAVLNQLSEEIASQLPEVDQDKKTVFMQRREVLQGLRPPGEDAPPEAQKNYQETKEEYEASVLDAARELLRELQPFLDNDALDVKLMKVAILRHGSPTGLAEFAQQGEHEKALLDQLFSNTDLMRQMLEAGGANGGEYGEVMQVYTALLEASEAAREPGILQRLALGTALQQPWLEGKSRGGVYGIVFTDNETPDGQVERFLHYEQAYLDGELDPAFEQMNTWECRFITNDPYTNEELAWTRQMLRTYRPDHITNADYKWRYTRFVKSDVPYQSPNWDDALGTKTQQIVAGGGKCGPRAFYGRTLTRAFGIPARRSTQTGHAAMSRWTPDGWTICFGAWWSMAWCGPQGGLDFLLDSQAREDGESYKQVLRAKWIGDALGEEDVSLRHYGQGGGFWDGLAFYKKRAIVEDAEIEALELVGGMKLGESDDLLGDEKSEAIEIPEQQKKIIINDDGVIVIPAVACTGPQNSSEKVAFMKSWDEGMQVHYQRLGNRPEILRYTVEVPSAGKYELTTKVATVSADQGVIFRLNRRTLVNVTLPYTKGAWQESQPETVELREGRNSIMVTFRAPNRGVTFKELRLKPTE